MFVKKEGKLQFDAEGRIKGVEGVVSEKFKKDGRAVSSSSYSDDSDDVGEGYTSDSGLKTSKDLGFLDGGVEDKAGEGEESGGKKLEGIIDTSGWSLYAGNEKLPPLKYSDGRTQEDVVKEIVELVKGGKKIIFLHGVCGTGKSAIALHIARELGRASIVVPVKVLQRQYEEDYMGKKHVLQKNGKKMKIAMITGRDNHDSLIKPGVSCADPYLPDTISLSEKNYEQIKEYYEDNPLINNKVDNPSPRELKRISIAPSNPYWSPIISADIDLRQLNDAEKKRYKGLSDKEFIFYHRKRGCSYYDQYQAYLDADVLIFNSAKYKIECALDRKPLTDIEIIDEGDEFLDSFSTQKSLNLTRLANALRVVVPDHSETEDVIDEIQELIKLEERHSRAVGVNEDEVHKLQDTKIEGIFKKFLGSSDLQAELALDELNYGNHAVEAAKDFEGFFADSYLAYRYDSENRKQNDFGGNDQGDLVVNIVTTNLSKKFNEIVDKNKAIVLMSGTIHSNKVLKEIFGLSDYEVVNAEVNMPGQVDILMTGKEFDCKYATFKNGYRTKEDYLKSLELCMERAKRPTLIQVNAFEDLPSEDELNSLGLVGVMFKERLKSLQKDDKTGRLISMFKSGVNDALWSTKCSRGVDFPGEVCNSVIFTKYPNPNVRNIFWKVLEKTHPDHFWDFYKDKARREFLQRLFRAIRFPGDKVTVLSPDTRVLDMVRNLQRNGL